jgi:peptidoglycan/xylan/chitin deacetylase (PgdA/CDA1 family)
MVRDAWNPQICRVRVGVLRVAKNSLLATKGMGTFWLVSNSTFRRNRLLILCYHGISMGDEHGSHPEMFMLPSTFERRMDMLKQVGCNVLGLTEALSRLRAGSLPPRSVALTFDDGWADFHKEAFPILRKHGFPATVYLTTYYCLFSRPIFRFALGYMFWKRQGNVVRNDGHGGLLGELDLRTPESRAALVALIDSHAQDTNLSGKEKDELAAQIALVIGFDYQAFLRDRLMQLMNPAEVREVSNGGIDIQLHTHRHRTPLDRTRFIAEIEENRRVIKDLVGSDATHFCYPSGAVRPDFVSWLQDAGVQSATTCSQDLSSRETNLLLLPRLLDQHGISDNEFEAWITGFAAFMPKRRLNVPDEAPE